MGVCCKRSATRPAWCRAWSASPAVPSPRNCMPGISSSRIFSKGENFSRSPMRRLADSFQLSSVGSPHISQPEAFRASIADILHVHGNLQRTPLMRMNTCVKIGTALPDGGQFPPLGLPLASRLGRPPLPRAGQGRLAALFRAVGSFRPGPCFPRVFRSECDFYTEY
ncbi:uncharacterized protein LOC129594495 [Paramacrobiotus metropolitanus]|uniref:uncharacterized protein LOC129594495 n=1 Tax=Paramacrobiotus metropolitanus TaxID=2943436 RepID=UPI002445CBAE|nr:uncharacterized protein LOC129594495 [Paramacrobiotus metropolitanus]